MAAAPAQRLRPRPPGTGGMLLFGGYDEDLSWKLSAAPGGGALGAESTAEGVLTAALQENRWQLLQPTGTAPTPRESHSAVWRAGTGGMLLFGGYDEDLSWKLSAAPGGGALGAQSPQLRFSERPAPVRGRGGWGTRELRRKSLHVLYPQDIPIFVRIGGSSSSPAAPHPHRGTPTARCGAPRPAECWSSAAWTRAGAGSSAWLTETELSEASPQLR
eukprot:Skav233279  [mRNA]  locus=scaffold114:55543:58252:- [translate_table: standard]